MKAVRALTVTVVAIAAGAALTPLTPVHASEVPLPKVVSANPVDWTPDVENGRVRQTATVGDVTIAVGNFTQVTERGTGTTFDRQDIVAFDTTGAVSTTFVPQFDGPEIYDVIPSGDGSTVYVAGAFANVDGLARTGRVVRLNVTTGAVDPAFRSPGLDNRATELALVEGRLLVGGSFTTVGGQPRTQLVELDPTTGDDTGHVDLTFAGTQNGGVTTVTKMAASADGDRLVVVGNFLTVDGQSRPQIAVVDISATNAQLHSWATQRYGTQCSPHFKSYVNDVDVSPDSSFFVVVTTGAYSGGPNAGTLCDTVARWELGTTGGGQDPTWVDYTGGDTVTAVAVTGPVTYVGGHFRWLNNPYANDQVGPGGVHRRALAALDSRNGLPLTWDPERQRGWGVWGFRVAPEGLWVGHDTDVIGGEQRNRVALLPVKGGSALPDEATGSIPGKIHLLGRASSPYSGRKVLYRVNAGGPKVLSIDGGPDWAADTSANPSPFHGWGSVSASWRQTMGRSAKVPASTPQSIFSVERADPASAPEMSWSFPVKAGTKLKVRLYFASGCSCTNDPGERTFDVSIDGTNRLNDYDIVADVGHSVGTVKTFSVVSDGNVDIAFRHVVENPLVNGIEILRTKAVGDLDPYTARVRTFRFDGAGVTRSWRGSITSSPTNWAGARGAFMVDGRLYTGWSDGRLLRRTYQAGQLGRAKVVKLYGLSAFSNDLQSTYAMFYDRSSGRLYFNQAGEPGLSYRYFTPESAVVGAIRQAGPGDLPGISWGKVRGTFLAGSTLYFTTRSGGLRSVGWSDGAPVGKPVTLSGPGVDGRDWSARALFLLAK